MAINPSPERSGIVCGCVIFSLAPSEGERAGVRGKLPTYRRWNSAIPNLKQH